MDSRVQWFKKAKPLAVFPKDRSIVMIGCGSIGTTLLPVLFKLVDFNVDKMYIIDKLPVNKREYKNGYVRTFLDKGIHFKQIELTRSNYKRVLSFMKSGDILIDLAYDISTMDLLRFCHKKGILFLNTSVEEWNPYSNKHHNTTDYTLYHRHTLLQKMISKWPKDSPTALIDCGANPGMVSIFVKLALIKIAKKQLKSTNVSLDTKHKIRNAIENDHFKLLSYLLGLKVVHISERDSQISCNPKKPNEFVNTWSIDGFVEEGAAPAELSWGTHEKKLPENAVLHKVGEKHQICLKNKGATVMMRSYIRSGPIDGMLIRHGEAYSIGHRYSVYPEDIKNPVSYVHCHSVKKQNVDTVVNRPTVHYVYMPCDAALASMHEFRSQNFKLQKNKRVMTGDIVSGKDELGCVLYGDFGVWWIGSQLDIHESRKLLGTTEINATGVQVVGMLISSIIYTINHPNISVNFADDLEYKEIWKTLKHFMGPMHSHALKLPKKEFDRIKNFQFSDFEAKDLI